MSTSSAEFNRRCDLARPKFAQWSSEPYPTDQFVFPRWTMSGLHLMILEILQNIYNQLDSITPADEQRFAMFCLFGTQTIENHHDMEETVIFPMMAPEFTTDVLAEHAAFAGRLHELDNYLKSVLGVKQGSKNGAVIPVKGMNKEPFKAATIKHYLEQMADPLFTHLEHELEWLAPEKIRSSGLATKRLEEIDAKSEEYLRRHAVPSLLVFALHHIPPYCQFPRLPWVLTNVLVPYVFWWKYRPLWNFLPKSFAQP